MAWIGLLALMLMVAAAPGIVIYLEHLRTSPVVAPDHEPPHSR
ncbi:MAG: hypothetical protein AB4911_08565 [Oscillochloridaceae bacterium umkhey_bin13]